jgi:hypothetical protein
MSAKSRPKNAKSRPKSARSRLKSARSRLKSAKSAKSRPKLVSVKLPEEMGSRVEAIRKELQRRLKRKVPRSEVLRMLITSGLPLQEARAKGSA